MNMNFTVDKIKEAEKLEERINEVRKLVRAYNSRLNSAIGTYGKNSVVVKEMMKEVATIPEAIIQYSSRGTGFIATGREALEKMASKPAYIKAIERKTKGATVKNVLEKLEKNYKPENVIQGPLPKSWNPNRKQRVARLEIAVPYVRNRTNVYDEAFSAIYNFYDPTPHPLGLSNKLVDYIKYYEDKDDKETPYQLVVRIVNRNISKDELINILNFQNVKFQSQKPTFTVEEQMEAIKKASDAFNAKNSFR